jgi:hypothetical protein
VKKSEHSQGIEANEDSIHISSLDILAYAYLKAELNNTPQAKEVKYLQTRFPNLIAFVERLDT